MAASHADAEELEQRLRSPLEAPVALAFLQIRQRVFDRLAIYIC